MNCRFALFISTIQIFASQAFGSGVSWEEQAERLQFVSAALLDHMPMAEMPKGGSNILFKSNISKLPETNPTVGSKSEKVPTSPVHAVPTIQADICKDAPMAVRGLRVWGGILPSGSEKLVGLNASISEKSFGVGVLLRLKMAGVEPSFEVGAQRSIATVSGAITALDAEDKFHVDTLIGYGAAGARFPGSGIWTNVMAVARSSRSEFSIPADGTYFELNDNHGPVGFQASVGADLFLGINIGIGQLYLPDRLTMTRILTGIKVSL